MGSADTHFTTRQVSEIFFKTQKCRYFGWGQCTRGLSCNFAHTTAELRPRMNLACTKLCPTLLKMGSCTDASCYYAHRREDKRGKRPRHRRCVQATSPNQSDSCYPNTSQLLFDDTWRQPVVDSLMMESTDLVANGDVNGIAHMIETPTTDAVTVADSAKHIEASRAFAHHDLLVTVKKTFINVEHADVPLLVGMNRSSSAPGSISVESVIQWTKCD